MKAFLINRFGNGGFLYEDLWIGQWGYFFICLSFVAVLLASSAYFVASFSSKYISWKKIAHTGFTIHAVSVGAIFILLFMMIFNHHFEYYYAWRHSSISMEMKYIISSFWEGQEGSFLLWQFWHVVLGFLLIWRLPCKWSMPVMATLSLVQLFLVSMILGVYIFDFRIGSNPFILLREAMDAPIFQRPNYLDFIADGNGLNPLLRNYWMTIHPPVLFLGFASTIVPFSFAISGLIKKDYDGWVKYAIPWTLFSVAALGAGILMGGAWAYEALSFGGFWAWDPVENASLVPWIILVAGLHTMVAYKPSKHGLASTFFFLILAYCLILLSTFLTRSGILGDSSVHSFTENGMFWQLTFFFLFFTTISFCLFITNWSKIPSPTKEETLNSREFWIFTGSLILLVSGLLIAITTTIPIWNKLFFWKWFDIEIAPPADPVKHYDSIQVWFAIVIAFLSGITQYYRYRNDSFKRFFKSIYIPSIIGFLLGVLVSEWQNISLFQPYEIGGASISFISGYGWLIVASIFTICTNAYYLFFIAKGHPRQFSASITHIGFGLMLLGIVISQYNKRVISLNEDGIHLGPEYDEKEQMANVLLLKGQSKKMGEYEVTYLGESIEKPYTLYGVRYLRTNETTLDTIEWFDLYPKAEITKEATIIPEPATKHYWNKDVFTYVTSVPNQEAAESDQSIQKIVSQKDTLFTSKYYLYIDEFVPNPPISLAQKDVEYSISMGVRIIMGDAERIIDTLQPIAILNEKSGAYTYVDDVSNNQEIRLRLNQILPETKQIELYTSEENPFDDFIIMKALIFPHINILWFGCIIMIFGLMFGAYHRRIYRLKK